ncbi:permease [Nocardia thailandica]|uniref:Permease n=1 Tax=Nocardia thailandica TaxID=257275 RepID=A0ABW6PXW7_9NOCA
MTSGDAYPTERKSTAVTWRNRAIITVATAVVLVITYFVLASFIPRWWAQQIGRTVHGSFTQGIWWGLVYGFVCTVVPLLLVLLAIRVWKRKGGKFLAGAAILGAVVVAIPNLMTLGIVLGGNNAAHAGERILDVDAPAFRGATLVGVIVAVVVFALVLALMGRRGLRRRKAAKAGTVPAEPTAPPAEPPLS